VKLQPQAPREPQAFFACSASAVLGLGDDTEGNLRSGGVKVGRVKESPLGATLG